MNRQSTLVICLLLLFIQELSAQHIATLPLPKSVIAKSKIAMPLRTKKVATPAELKNAQANRYIALYKNGNRAYLDTLLLFLESPAILQARDSFFVRRQKLLAKVVPALDSAVVIKSIDTLPALKDSVTVIDSAAMVAAATGEKKDTTSVGTEAVTESCAEIKKVINIHLEKNVNGEYIVSLQDAQQNPLRSFTIRQFNESLVQDQLRESLSSLCTQKPLAKEDSDYIEGLITAFAKLKLYDKMLEASLEVNDANVYAGVLKIFKRVQVICIYEKQKKDSAAKPNRATPASGSTSFLRKPNTTGMLAAHTPITGLPWPPVMEDTTKPSDMNVYSRVKLKDSTQKYKWFSAYSIQIQFQDGFIENIKVLGKIDGEARPLKFENEFPLPFTTRRDFRKLNNIYLLEKTIYSGGQPGRAHNIKECRLNLGDLLFYDQKLDVNSKDYSPANQVLDTLLTDEVTSVNLLKEQTSKILELKVFTDLKGIDNTNPNGLVQLELAKKLNFWNNRTKIFKNLFNVGLFNYITPYFTMNKIENNNKRLALSYRGTQKQDTLKPNSFASTLNLYQYQTFGIGVNLTCLTVDIPGLKSTVSFNMGMFFGHTLLEDTMRVPGKDSSTFKAQDGNNVRQFGINSFQVSPEICWQVFPDKRYGITMSQRFIHYNLLNADIKQVRDSVSYGQYLSSLKGDRSKIDAYNAKKWLGAAEVYAFFKPSQYNQVFFRYRLNWDLDNARLNFHQIQVGISTYLTHTKKDKPEQ